MDENKCENIRGTSWLRSRRNGNLDGKSEQNKKASKFGKPVAYLMLTKF